MDHRSLLMLAVVAFNANAADWLPLTNVFALSPTVEARGEGRFAVRVREDLRQHFEPASVVFMSGVLDCSKMLIEVESAQTMFTGPDPRIVENTVRGSFFRPGTRAMPTFERLCRGDATLLAHLEAAKAREEPAEPYRRIKR